MRNKLCWWNSVEPCPKAFREFQFSPWKNFPGKKINQSINQSIDQPKHRMIKCSTAVVNFGIVLSLLLCRRPAPQVLPFWTIIWVPVSGEDFFGQQNGYWLYASVSQSFNVSFGSIFRCQFVSKTSKLCKRLSYNNNYQEKPQKQRRKCCWFPTVFRRRTAQKLAHISIPEAHMAPWTPQQPREPVEHTLSEALPVGICDPKKTLSPPIFFPFNSVIAGFHQQTEATS